MLTAKYLKGIPEGSRAAQGKSLRPEFLNERAIANIRALNEIAERRGQTLAQMAIAWVLRDGGITSALIGASRPAQVEDCVGAVTNLDFTAEELAEIDRYADEEDINLWASPPREEDGTAPVARGVFFVYGNRCGSCGTNRNAAPTSPSMDSTSPTSSSDFFGTAFLYARHGVGRTECGRTPPRPAYHHCRVRASRYRKRSLVDLHAAREPTGKKGI